MVQYSTLLSLLLLLKTIAAEERLTAHTNAVGASTAISRMIL